MEYYEIAQYGIPQQWVMQFGIKKAAAFLRETLEKESWTDELLTEIASK